MQPEYVADQLMYNGSGAVLGSLALRGITLNTWQINKLLLDGDRRYGKTYLAYVKLALNMDRQQTFYITDDLSIYDPDATSTYRNTDFITGLEYFLNEHFADKFHTVLTSDKLIVVPK